MSHWRHFSHQADIGVRGEGATMEEAFAQTALAMSAVITELNTISAREAISITCEAPDPEMLLVDWLNALVYEMATRHMLFSRFEVTIEGTRLHATAWGERVDAARHQPAVEVKGASYTALEVGQGIDGHWHAQCVVDV